MGSRRKAREFALQMLYQLDLRGYPMVEVFETFWTGVSWELDERVFAEQVVRGVVKQLKDIDATIERHSTNWKIARMPIVDRNILRMGVFELLNLEDIPISVTLNEAIELGKRYSSPESGSFINGILDKVARVLPEGTVKHLSGGVDTGGQLYDDYDEGDDEDGLEDDEDDGLEDD